MKAIFHFLLIAAALTLLFTQCDKEDPVPEVDVPDNRFLNALIDLDTLICNQNYISHLDISNCTSLKWLECRRNELTNLDVSHNTALERLDLSNNISLKALGCSYNK